MRLLISLGLVLLLFNSIFGQKSTLFGTITDQETGEPVPGGKVFVQGTFLGDLADLEGKYEIENLKKGTYDLICESEGYFSDTLFAVTVREKFLEKNFKLRQIPCKPRKDKEPFADLVFHAPDSISLEEARRGIPVSMDFSARFGDKFGVFRTFGLRDREIVFSLHRKEKMDCEPVPAPEFPYYADQWSEKLILTEPGSYRLNVYSDDYGRSVKMVDLVVY
ncbi:MAG: carboxypeptidase-like regulatory domain-containing protein [Bacteroidia bacterium]|nr:carboxypeptidase-like regulatory domain-containing protein [Bacteroidia bacterium]